MALPKRITPRIILLLSLLFTTALAGAISPDSVVQAQTGTIVRVTPQQSQVNVGGTVTITLQVTGGQNVNAFDFTLLYNPALAALETWSPGTYLSNTFQVYKNEQFGRIRVAYTQLATPGVSGDGTLFNLVFRGLAEGSNEIILDEIIFADPNGNQINPEHENGTLTVLAAAAPSPTPSATSAPTETPLPSPTPLPTNTPLPTATAQNSATPLPLATSAPTGTAVPSPTLLPLTATLPPSTLATPIQFTPGSLDSTLNQPIPTMTHSAPKPAGSASPTQPSPTAGPQVTTAAKTPPKSNPIETLLWGILITGAIAILLMLILLAFRRRKTNPPKED